MEVNLKKEWSKDTLGPYGEDQEKKTPFELYIFPDLLEEEVVKQLRDDVNSSVKLKPKDNDLYKFKQSRDLRTEIPLKKLTPVIHAFGQALLAKVRPHLEKVTGLKLSEKNFDITASRYDVGDYLLCHNDDIKDEAKNHRRALAFVYYLNSRPWKQDDGGALILYDSDPSGEPVEINNYIHPRPNTLVVFNTTSTSWHSVQEVYCKDDFRLSINGWFHVDEPAPSLSEPMIEPCPYSFYKPIPVDAKLEKFFSEFFNPEYLLERTYTRIRKEFKRKSEINLSNFLIPSKFQEISAALKEATRCEENLVHIGPYNKRNYKIIRIEKLPPIVKDLYDAFRSELFYMLLSRLTGLDLVPPSIKDDEQIDDDDSDESSCLDFSSDEDEDEDEEDDEDEDEDEDDDEDEDEENFDGDGDSKKGEEGEKEDKKVEKDDKTNLNLNKDLTQQASASISLSTMKGDDQVTRQLKSIHDEFPKRKTTDDDEPTTSKDKSDGGTKDKSPRKRKRTADPLARYEFRHLEAGSYTLLHDQSFELGEKSALDVILHFNHDFEVNFEKGGFISYLDGTSDDSLHDMDCELLTMEPKSNCLSLVYRCDEGTCRFLKHISKAHKASYQDLYCVYYERPDDLPKEGRPHD